MSAVYEQEMSACTVDGRETDYAVIAQKMTEKYAEALLARPSWYRQTVLDVVPVGAQVFDAYYGEDFPNFCFELVLYIKINEEQRNEWEVGSGLDEALGSGKYAGYYVWGREAQVLRDENGNWYLEGLNTGGCTVYLPVREQEASAKELIEMFLLTDGFTHDYLLLYYLAEKPLDEVLAQMNLLGDEQREILKNAIVDFIEEYPDYTTWSTRDFS